MKWVRTQSSSRTTWESGDIYVKFDLVRSWENKHPSFYIKCWWYRNGNSHRLDGPAVFSIFENASQIHKLVEML